MQKLCKPKLIFTNEFKMNGLGTNLALNEKKQQKTRKQKQKNKKQKR